MNRQLLVITLELIFNLAELSELEAEFERRSNRKLGAERNQVRTSKGLVKIQPRLGKAQRVLGHLADADFAAAADIVRSLETGALEQQELEDFVVVDVCGEDYRRHF